MTIWLVSAIPCAFMLFLLSCQIVAEVPVLTLTVPSRVFVNCNVIFLWALSLEHLHQLRNVVVSQIFAMSFLAKKMTILLTITVTWKNCSFKSFYNVFFKRFTRSFWQLDNHLNYWACILAEGRPGKDWTVNKHSQFH